MRQIVIKILRTEEKIKHNSTQHIVCICCLWFPETIVNIKPDLIQSYFPTVPQKISSIVYSCQTDCPSASVSVSSTNPILQLCFQTVSEGTEQTRPTSKQRNRQSVMENHDTISILWLPIKHTVSSHCYNICRCRTHTWRGPQANVLIMYGLEQY